MLGLYNSLLTQNSTSMHHPNSNKYYLSLAHNSSSNTGLKYLGGTSVLVLGSWAAYSASQPANYDQDETQHNVQKNVITNIMSNLNYSQFVRQRIMKTYAYLTASLAITGVTTSLLFLNGYASYLLENPLLFGIPTLISTFVSAYLTMTLSYDNSPIAKHVAWIATNSSIGLSILGLSAIAGSTIIKQASIITGCVVGGMSIAAIAAPSNSFLKLGSYLGVGLGVLIGASIAEFFFPRSLLLRDINFYGGLGLFALFTAHDTQRVLKHAQELPTFDPICEQMELYLDTVNIFSKVVKRLVESDKKKKKNQE